MFKTTFTKLVCLIADPVSFKGNRAILADLNFIPLYKCMFVNRKTIVANNQNAAHRKMSYRFKNRIAHFIEFFILKVNVLS